MKKLLFPIFLILSLSFVYSFDFKLIPKTVRSANSEGYYTKIPLSEISVHNGKLSYYQSRGYDFISFEGTYNEITGELNGIFTAATKYSPNSGYSYFCKFQSKIIKGQETTEFFFKGDTVDDCYNIIIFNIEKQSKGGKNLWLPDNLFFTITEMEGVEDSGVRFSDIAGQVEILFPTGYDDEGEPIFDDEEGWNHAKLDMEIPYGAKVRLKEKSRIVLAVPGSEPYEMKTPANLYPHDETVIMLPLKNKKDNIFKLMAGQLYNNVKKMVSEGSMDIEMGQAVCGIKGTTFILEEDGTTSRIKVVEGIVDFKHKANGEIIKISAGEQVTATQAGFLEKTTYSFASEKDKWSSQPGSFSSFLGLIIVLLVTAGIVFFIKKRKMMKPIEYDSK